MITRTGGRVGFTTRCKRIFRAGAGIFGEGYEVTWGLDFVISFINFPGEPASLREFNTSFKPAYNPNLSATRCH